MRNPEVERTMEIVRRELAQQGSLTPEDTVGVLATILPDELEGHFRVDPHSDGSWTISTTFPDQEIRISGAVSPNALAALAIEVLHEARWRYRSEFRDDSPPPIPPPSVRARKKEDLAEELIAAVVNGHVAPRGTPGYDVVASDGRRIQVKASVRNPKSGLISTLQFRSGPAYYDHDELVYVEFSSQNYPLGAWTIESDVLRAHLPNDNKTHHVEPILHKHGSDLEDPVATAFEALFMSARPTVG